MRQIVWLRGTVQVHTDVGVRFHLNPGSVWSSTSIEPATFTRIGTTEANGIELIFKSGMATEYATFLAEHFGRLIRISNSPSHKRLLSALLDYDKVHELRHSQKVFAWLSTLHLALQNARMHLSDLLRGIPDQLREECAQHGHSIKTMAAHFGCTPTFLAGRLRRAWRMPAGEVLRSLRHEYARHLLNSSKLPIADIAWRCSFSSTAAFSTSFKRIEGISPSLARAKESPIGLITRHSQQVVRNEKNNPPAGQKIWDETPVAVWTGPYFQFDGGEVDWPYSTPFDLAINGITNAINWIYTLEGEAIFDLGEKRITVRPGMVLVYPKPLNARWLTPTGKTWRRIWINARGRWASEALIKLAQAHGWAAKIPASSAPVKLARQWVRYWNEHRNEPSIVGSQAAYAWLLSWWRLLQSGRVSPIPLPDLRKLHSRSFFRRIKTITRYAEEIGYSRAHISRKLRAQWKGGTPAQIVRRQRLAQAALELRQTRLSVAEIATRAQFSCAGSFIPAFKREFGLTPLAYRFSQS